jgi:small subunit ribosomal protein S17
MKKKLNAKVVTVSQNSTVIVEVFRKTAHPLYKKMITRSKRYAVDANEHSLSIGDLVTIEETVKMSHSKYFKVVEVKK